MFKKLFIIVGGIVMIPLIFSCASSSTDGIMLKKAKAERAISAAKTSMAEYSKCTSAAKKYFDADNCLKQGEGYMTNRYNWETAEGHFDNAIKLAEQAEEESVLCDKK
jgi:hypothetical protein